MIVWRSLFRSSKVLNLASSKVIPTRGIQFQVHYHDLSNNRKMGSKKGYWSVMEQNKKLKKSNLVWRSVSSKASSCEESSAVEDVLPDSKDSSQVQEVLGTMVCETSTIEKDVDQTDSEVGLTTTSCAENEPISSEKHSISVEVGSSLMRFIKGKGGSTQKKIEEENGVKIVFPSSRKEGSIKIEGNSADDISRASKKIEALIEEVHYHDLSNNRKMGSKKGSWNVMEQNKKLKNSNLVWRSVSSKASSCEESSAVEDVLPDSKDSNKVQEVRGTMVSETSTIEKDVDQTDSEVVLTSTASASMEMVVCAENEPISSEKHSISVEVGSSLMRFIKGKGGSTQKKIEEENGVKIVFPSSKKEDSIKIEGNSADDISRASKKIEALIEEVVQSPSLDYSHFISLPLAIHPELVEKLFSFQASILGKEDDSAHEKAESEASEETSDGEEKVQPQQVANVEVKLSVEDGHDRVKVNLSSIPLVSYAPKASALGICKSIFIKPRTFHLTVLMLKLWNKERVAAATEVMQGISSKVIEALDNRPIFIRLKGLDCMRGSVAKARVLYAPVEEIGSEDRLIRACQIITDAYIEAGLVLEKDAKEKLKLHATIMNSRHRRSKKGEKKRDTFDASGIFEQYGSEEWGEYLIREVHLSKRYMFDENGYYHCCASIPFPEATGSD